MELLKGVALPTSIGLGAALQAVVGACLVRRVVGFPNPLSRGRDIGAFLGLGEPVSCLINATVGVTSLLISGKIPWVAYFHNWWTWWIGDTWRPHRHPTAAELVGRTSRHLAPPAAVGGCATRECIDARRRRVRVYEWPQERERQQLTFEHQAENLAHTIEGHFDRYLEMLRSMARFYASSQEVKRDEFRTFVHGALAHHPDIQALSWDRRVPDVLREGYEEAVR